MLNDPDFARALTAHYCSVMRQLCSDSENLSLNNVTVRFITFLLSNFKENEHINLRQHEIATVINCSVSSVSGIIASLVKERCIETEGIGLRITSISRLNTILEKNLKSR